MNQLLDLFRLYSAAVDPYYCKRLVHRSSSHGGILSISPQFLLRLSHVLDRSVGPFPFAPGINMKTGHQTFRQEIDGE